MDPEANWQEQRTLAAKMIAEADAGREIAQEDALRLAELVEALDDWMSKGGFPPIVFRVKTP